MRTHINIFLLFLSKKLSVLIEVKLWLSNLTSCLLFRILLKLWDSTLVFSFVSTSKKSFLKFSSIEFSKKSCCIFGILRKTSSFFLSNSRVVLLNPLWLFSLGNGCFKKDSSGKNSFSILLGSYIGESSLVMISFWNIFKLFWSFFRCDCGFLVRPLSCEIINSLSNTSSSYYSLLYLYPHFYLINLSHCFDYSYHQAS